MTGVLNSHQIDCLVEPLNREFVRQRNQGGSNVSYIEGWHAINEANRLFGFGNWMRETISMDCVSSDNGKCTYIAKVRITVQTEEANGFKQIVREGTGAGHGKFKNAGDNHESATKEAETDAMNRALMTFGNPFGLALYDKEQRQVVNVPKPAKKIKMNDTNKRWCAEMIKTCNETEWDRKSFDSWKTEIRDQFKTIKSQNPEDAQELQDYILEKDSKISEENHEQS